jgi:hypothetical protein
MSETYEDPICCRNVYNVTWNSHKVIFTGISLGLMTVSRATIYRLCSETCLLRPPVVPQAGDQRKQLNICAVLMCQHVKLYKAQFYL